MSGHNFIPVSYYLRRWLVVREERERTCNSMEEYSERIKTLHWENEEHESRRSCAAAGQAKWCGGR